MGNCTSCLGHRHQDAEDEQDDEARLLFDDPNGPHYGSFGNQQLMNGQQDPQEAQREIEALQRVVTATSDSMVDIYEIAPRTKAPFIYSGQDVRSARYQSLVSKLSLQDDTQSAGKIVSADWDSLTESEGSPVQVQKDATFTSPVKIEEPAEPLVGNFADADVAMR